jgi:hypothetical protein
MNPNNNPIPAPYLHKSAHQNPEAEGVLSFSPTVINKQNIANQT